MLDQLSNQPLPPFTSCTDDVFWVFRDEVRNESYGITPHAARQVVYRMLLRDDPQYSYAAWVAGAMDEYVAELDTFLQRRKRARWKIKSYLKTLSRLLIIYRRAVETRYKPGGAFETQMSLVWNPVLDSY
jgi:hypothetical protein